MTKIERLRKILLGFKNVLIAYSGGVDSTFLLATAIKILDKENVLAVIASSETYPEEEAKKAKEMAEQMGATWREIKTEEFKDENFLKNQKERCYYCKKELFGKLAKLAKQANLKYVCDGSNVDDFSDFRPGAKAKAELGVRSPLQEAGFTKADIRKASKKMGLLTWDKPSLACLSSRIPYGIRITSDILRKVGEGEKFLRQLGHKQLRVRHHEDMARIELDARYLDSRLLDPRYREKLVKKFKGLGYKYVTLDLQGYRTGSLNEVL